MADNSNVSIKYSALKDEYTFWSINESKAMKIRRADLRDNLNYKDKIVDKDLVEKIEKNLSKADINVINGLAKYDIEFKTNKLKKYLDILEKNYTPEERLKKLKENKIEIEYDLNGLYEKKEDDNEKLSLFDRLEIFKLADLHKEYGTGSVKKGFFVSLREKLDGLFSKFKRTKKVEQLGDGTGVPTREELAKRLKVEVEPIIEENKKENEKAKGKDEDLEK